MKKPSDTRGMHCMASAPCIFFFLVRSFCFVALTKKKNEQETRFFLLIEILLGNMNDHFSSKYLFGRIV
ncbi:hypothetical protein [Sulfurovum mangrovi]|uniref:hypothetical protein n=1 Tax=Sulfurovum mangrovi TaxID=2893889 RepID=UPI001E45DDCC|nr:hypothetical protein [Sulfurovum mangrovi]UFH58954.1 hypothetical protein LN246_11470 [Sulfurovum mangrovi]